MSESGTSILIIYTGGTIGMINDPETGSLAPFDFNHILHQVPELNKFGFNLTTITFEEVVDSSNVHPEIWIHLAELIEKNYEQYDGFVILHGTDTMSYSASALSFLLENLGKPVIFTGSQLPIGTLRTDGKENFISAIEIAAARKNQQPLVPEVCIFFENKLYRGTRTTKHNADYFDAFRSYNYPELAKAGINITYNYSAIHYPVIKRELKVYHKLDPNVAILKLFPGITPEVVEAITNMKNLKGIILESFGSGNAPTHEWFIEKIRQAVQRGVVVLNVTQCSAGSVDMGVYETSLGLMEAGVLSGKDITTEAAVTKLMFLLGQHYNKEEIKEYLSKSLRGEINA
ncbi:MAG: L-asparaginase 1 [Bacteroidetes bacterium HGW-Bacteroidetes-4]|jgi:L-asparaginase|nr:MAG: L-asparaginase 1 [Bacteroidetes bacterium HGW-Bacteroidetes-4]